MPTRTPTLVWVAVPALLVAALSKWASPKAETVRTAGSALRIASAPPASAPGSSTTCASTGRSARARRVTVAPEAVPNSRTLVIKADAIVTPTTAASVRRGSRTTRRTE